MMKTAGMIATIGSLALAGLAAASVTTRTICWSGASSGRFCEPGMVAENTPIRIASPATDPGYQTWLAKGLRSNLTRDSLVETKRRAP